MVQPGQVDALCYAISQSSHMRAYLWLTLCVADAYNVHTMMLQQPGSMSNAS